MRIRLPQASRHRARGAHGLVTLTILLALALLLAPAGTARAAPAAAATPERWAALTHTAFKHHLAPEVSGTNSFAQDDSGFIWMGTQSGLLRWDGYRLRRYMPDAKRTDAIPDGFVLSLLVDGRGRLWIGTSSGGLARYDAARDIFVGFAAGPGGVSNARIPALAEDGEGGLWIGTGAGLDHMAASGAITQGGGLAAGALPAGGADALLRDRDGVLWIGTRNGLVRRAPRSAEVVPVVLGAARDKQPAIQRVFQDSSGRIWIGTRSNGAFVLEPGAQVPQPVRESTGPSTLAHERVTAIEEVGQGEIWLATEGSGGGIVVVDPLRGSTRRIRHQPDATDSLYDNDVYSLFRERSGLVFAASMLAISQHDPQPRAVTTIRGSRAGAPGRLSIPSMALQPDGRVWLGVADGGIDIVDPVRGRVGRIDTGAPGGLPKGRILALQHAPADGKTYIGNQLGLFSSDAGGKRIVRIDIPGRAASASTWTLALEGNTLWLGGLDGLWALELASGKAPRLLRHEEKHLLDSRITTLLPLANGVVWIGTRSGLARFDRASGKVEVLPTHASAPGRLPPGYVSSMRLDRRGRLWVSTFGAGISILERTDAAGRHWFRRIGMDEGLPDTSVNLLLDDVHGMFWASTDSGLARIDPDSFSVRALGPGEGVQVTSYWTNSGVRTAEGELLFGGISGLTVLRPEQMSAWTYMPPVVVSKILLNDQEIASSVYNPTARSGRAGPPPPIEITPEGRERGFALEFSALDFSAPERNQYSYRLAGFDTHWVPSEAGSRRVSYNNLPPGDYSLELVGSNRAGVRTAPLSVPVRVLPAWHQRLWVRLLAGLGAAGMLWALFQARTAYLLRRQRELQAMVDARTAELRATQSQLEHLAYADALTGLPNRRLFNDELRHMAAQTLRDASTFTLLLIDLDHFKHINDSLGHDAGDALLVAAAARLKAAVREADRVFRLGGDEFAVLLGRTSQAEVIDTICQRIVAGMAETIEYGEVAMRISASVGAAAFTGRESALEALYKAADVALYQSKASGRNTWTFFHGERKAARGEPAATA